jgi:glutamyl/glutaminyl-tRNA synthetase
MEIKDLHFAKTRIAPTPSGYLHVGNVLSFAITAALARQTGARILLRIDDLDRQRANTLFVQDIFDTLNFMEIPWDEGPRSAEEFEREWSQVYRMAEYQQALQQLKEDGKLFACTCSRAQISGENYPGTCRDKGVPFDTKDCCWRIHTDNNEEISIKTLLGDIKTTLHPQMHNLIVRKKDGYPAYQLASLIDDIHFGVDLIVRGEDLWSSTIAQNHLSRLIGSNNFDQTTFYHHPLLMADGNKKLSKSAGDNSIQKLRLNGKTAAEIYNNIAQSCGFSEQVNNWQMLGERLVSGIKK